MSLQIQPNDSPDQKWVKLGETLMEWASAMGVVYPSGDPMLTPIRASDSEGVKFVKFQRWLKAITQI